MGTKTRTVESLTVNQEGGPEAPATVGCWLVHCPVSHPVWSQYFVSLIVLRDVEGVKPATIVLEGATHEIMVFALNPKSPQTKESANASLSGGPPLQALQPVNICQQFKADDDADAMFKAQSVLEIVYSMDSDARSTWKQHLTGEK